jgi:Fe-S cluster assembly protein SufD
VLDPALVVVMDEGRLRSVRGGQPGVEVVAVSGGGDRVAIGEVSGEPDPFVILNRSLAPDPLLIRVAPAAVVADPLVVLHSVSGEGSASFSRVLVEVGAGAEVRVVELFGSADVAALVVPVTEIDVAEGANVGFVSVQALGERVWQLGLQASRVGRDATFTSAAVALGGSYARQRTDSALVGTGGSTRLLAMYFAAGHQLHDFRTLQRHAAPRTTSDLLYKGAVANQSRSVYSGLIRVEKGARKADALQTNRNLVLHEGAHADSVPNLEIEDNDVHCSHASAVGPIAEDQRFYLESRGVPAPVAERLIAVGFLDEVLERLPVPELGPELHQSVAAKLAIAEAAEPDVAR